MAESELKKVCPQCGGILSADARFCPKCGQMVDDAVKINEQSKSTEKKCSQCGALINENAKFCASCGTPVADDREIPNNGKFQKAQQKNEDKSSNSQQIVYEKNNGFWTTGRLVFGIFSILIFVFMVFQSCVAGTINTFSGSGEMSGTQGMLTAVMYLSAGITGIASRNSRSKGGPLASAILYWIGALFTAGGSDVYGDLMIWGVLAACLGLFFMYCAIRTSGDLKEKKRIIWLIISVIITALLIAMSMSGGESSREEDAAKGNEYDLVLDDNEETEIETIRETVAETSVETTAELSENETEALSQDMYIYNDENSVIPDSSKRLITDADVSGMTSEKLRIAVNEIYARHGRKFKDSELQAWFDSQTWYQRSVPPDQFDENSLSQIEKDNIKFLQQKRDSKSVSANKALSGKYEISFGSEGGAELEIIYSSGENLYSAAFNGSLGADAAGTEGFLSAYTDGTDNIWEYYDNGEFEAGNYAPSLRLEYNGADLIEVISLDGQIFGGMQFPGFSGEYTRISEYPMP